MKLIEILMNSTCVADETLAIRLHKEKGARVNGVLVHGDEMDDFDVNPGDVLEVGPYRWCYAGEDGRLHTGFAGSISPADMPDIYFKSKT